MRCSHWFCNGWHEGLVSCTNISFIPKQIFTFDKKKHVFLNFTHLRCNIEQVFNDAIEALRVSYKKMNPFCVPFATTNMGSAILAMDLV